MTHSPHDPIERDGTTYRFVVDDIAEAVVLAAQSAGDGWVSLLSGSISLFAGLGQRIKLERLETSAYASETHLRYRVLR